MSTTPTPENLRTIAATNTEAVLIGPGLLFAAADRIEALERIVRQLWPDIEFAWDATTHEGDDTVGKLEHDGVLDIADADLLRSILVGSQDDPPSPRSAVVGERSEQP